MPRRGRQPRKASRPYREGRSEDPSQTGTQSRSGNSWRACPQDATSSAPQIDVHPTDAEGKMPLHGAAKSKNTTLVEAFLMAGADPNYRDTRSCETALDVAARQGCVDIMRLLISHGANAADRNGRYGRTSLHCATALDDNAAAVDILVDAGADVNATMVARYTPLHDSSTGGTKSTETAAALLRAGADVNAREYLGFTPLYLACGASSSKMVELLLRWGADETAASSMKVTAMDNVGGGRYHDESNKSTRAAENQVIKNLLQKAPADRLWRRRGWLVLCRVRPHWLRLAQPRPTYGRKRKKRLGAGSDPTSRNALFLDMAGEGIGGGGSEDAFLSMLDRLVQIEAPDLFRAVVSLI